MSVRDAEQVVAQVAFDLGESSGSQTLVLGAGADELSAIVVEHPFGDS